MFYFCYLTIYLTNLTPKSDQHYGNSQITPIFAYRKFVRCLYPIDVKHLCMPMFRVDIFDFSYNAYLEFLRILQTLAFKYSVLYLRQKFYMTKIRSIFCIYSNYYFKNCFRKKLRYLFYQEFCYSCNIQFQFKLSTKSEFFK